MRIGLLGGTFNPIHNCHLQVAQEIAERFPLDQVLFIPSGVPPHKVESDLPSGDHRMEMTRLATARSPKFSVSAIEVRRRGPSYSIDTLRALASELPGEIFFILGIDAFLEIESWKEPDRLLTLCHFIVLSRPEHPFASLVRIPFVRTGDRTQLQRVDRGEIDRYVPAVSLSFSAPPPKTLTFFGVRPCLISATEIRRRLREGADLKNFLPESVQSYIIKNNLYGLKDASEGSPKR